MLKTKGGGGAEESVMTNESHRFLIEILLSFGKVAVLEREETQENHTKGEWISS